MTMESARGARGEGFAGTPTGFRRLTPSLLRADRTAASFDGLPDGVTVPGQLLAAFKAAAPRLGLSPRLVHAVDWLFRFTQPQDWGRGGRPIVWPSASMQQDSLGLSATQTKALNRALIEAGVVTMKDSPNGKRYGVRDRTGQISEAYGFDLSPIAARHPEFVRLAELARAERAEMGRLRRRATIARKGIAQILETAAEYGLGSEDWAGLARETRMLAQALKKVDRPEEMALGVESLERRQCAARERLETLLSQATGELSKQADSDPLGPESRPHQDTYKATLNPNLDTVIANRERSSGSGEPVPGLAALEQPASPQAAKPAPPVRVEGTVLRLSTEELVRLAPRLRPYLTTPTPTWPVVVDAADWLRGELGVSKSLWGEACLAMGREEAAIAVAIVSAKPSGHFRSSPGGYFHGMVAKAKAGDLNLARTIWGLRSRERRAGGGEGHLPRRAH
ncbi:MAG TPA: plasmid replication protein RepC [Acetobacteraceae bacterium]|nr:plasmid replication protein RepC [Acetobacteraceae bacterium]